MTSCELHELNVSRFAAGWKRGSVVTFSDAVNSNRISGISVSCKCGKF